MIFEYTKVTLDSAGLLNDQELQTVDSFHGGPICLNVLKRNLALQMYLLPCGLTGTCLRGVYMRADGTCS